MIEVVPWIFLAVIALVAIVFAIFQDWRTHEVANWISFSLLIFALGFRFFYSLLSVDGEWSFLYQGLIGFGIFFAIGNIFYYSKIFAGGDAKLMIALGIVLPFYEDFMSNLNLFATFIFLFLISGAIFGIIMGVKITLSHRKEFRKEFYKRFKSSKVLFYITTCLAILFVVLGFFFELFFVLGIIIFVLPYFYVWAKSVDESCMTKEISTSRLREGDWLYRNLRIGNRLIKARWEGLTKKEISFLKNHKSKIVIKEGIPFTPVFLISFILLLIKVFFLG